MKNIRDLNLKNKSVLVRCDFNVPLSKNGEVEDDLRLRKTIPTINYLIEKEAKVILISHLGRPKGKRNENYTLRPVVLKLSDLLGKDVKFVDDSLNNNIKSELSGMEKGDVVLLENLRFYKGEEEASTDFAASLAELGSFFINDAFGVCHREHASVTELPKLLPSAAGFLLEEEVKVLSKLLEGPERPMVSIIGGVKASSKIKALKGLLKASDHVLLGGKIHEPILQAKGMLVGRKWPEDKVIEAIREIDLTSTKIHLPIDGLASLPELEEGYSRETAMGKVRKEEEIYDIGPETVNLFLSLIKEAKTIIWAGPLGFFEKKPFDRGSVKIAEAIVNNKSAFKVSGGGDTNSFLLEYGFRDKFDYISTGGGAMLRLLSGETLPGIKILEENGN
jgi:3-phosphoglycerate kinase